MKSNDRRNTEQVTRMERSEIRGQSLIDGRLTERSKIGMRAGAAPDVAALHPGYAH